MESFPCEEQRYIPVVIMATCLLCGACTSRTEDEPECALVPGGHYSE